MDRGERIEAALRDLAEWAGDFCGDYALGPGSELRDALAEAAAALAMPQGSAEAPSPDDLEALRQRAEGWQQIALKVDDGARYWEGRAQRVGALLAGWPDKLDEVAAWLDVLDLAIKELAEDRSPLRARLIEIGYFDEADHDGIQRDLRVFAAGIRAVLAGDWPAMPGVDVAGLRDRAVHKVTVLGRGDSVDFVLISPAERDAIVASLGGR